MGSSKTPNHFSRRDVLKLGFGFSLTPFIPFAALNKQDDLAMTNIFDPSATSDIKLERRAIPVSGETIPVVGLGTWRTFDAGNSKERRKNLLEVLKTLNKEGASVIDSSPMYGSSESVVGDLSQEINIRPSLFLATKVWTSGKDDGISQMNQSFRFMKTEKMDLMQVHNLVDVQTHLQTLRNWKEQGKIKYFERVQRIIDSRAHYECQ